MSKRVCERSGRAYPHNAIYEILTYSIPVSKRNEPRQYNQRTVNEYWKMLERVNPLTRKAYELVYANGNSLKEAGELMKMSSTSVARYLRLIYFTRDEFGYCVANLEKTARSSNVTKLPEMSGYSMARLEKIHSWMEHSHFKTSLSSREVENILVGFYCDHLKTTTIADYYGLDELQVSDVISAFINQ